MSSVDKAQTSAKMSEEDLVEQAPAKKDVEFPDFIDPTMMKAQDVHFMRRYLTHFVKRRDHEKLLAELPVAVKRRVLALKKLQVDTLHLDAAFHRRVYDMEKDFQKEHDQVFEKRLDIILGKREPLEEEVLASQLSQLSLDKPSSSDDQPTGVPNFWLTIFKYVPKLDAMVKEQDEAVLSDLLDVKVRTQSEPHLSFTLEFHFAPNDFFTDAILQKEYFLKCDPEADDPFNFDGPEIFKTRGCEIHWKDGKNVTVELVDGVEMKVESFFNFFTPPDVPNDPASALFEAVNAVLEADFEIGHYIKDRIVPRAVLYFTGEARDDMDEISGGSLTDSNLELVYEQDKDGNSEQEEAEQD